MLNLRDETGSARSQLDEFLLGFRDCANESLRYLETSTVTVSEADEAGTDGRRLVDALRVHLSEHEKTLRRRRRSPDDNKDKPVVSATSLGCVDEQHSSRQPRRRRRLRITTAAMLQRRRHRHSGAFHHCLQDSQHLQPRTRDDRFSASSRKPSERNSTSGDASCDEDSVCTDTSGLSVENMPADEQFDQGNIDELRHCAYQLSHLADRDVRVGQLLNELFQLMDSDVED